MNVKDYEEKEFDALLNKTIILSSKDYYRKQMTISNNESLLINKNDEDIYSNIIDDIDFIDVNTKSYMQHNLKKPSIKPSNRDEFWKDYEEQEFEYIMKKYAKYEEGD